jgi:hypothetical protein
MKKKSIIQTINPYLPFLAFLMKVFLDIKIIKQMNTNFIEPLINLIPWLIICSIISWLIYQTIALKRELNREKIKSESMAHINRLRYLSITNKGSEERNISKDSESVKNFIGKKYNKYVNVNDEDGQNLINEISSIINDTTTAY